MFLATNINHGGNKIKIQVNTAGMIYYIDMQNITYIMSCHSYGISGFVQFLPAINTSCLRYY